MVQNKDFILGPTSINIPVEDEKDKKIAALEQRCKELEQEKQSFIEHHEAQMEDWKQERDELLQKVQQLDAENAELRKRLEPIEALWNKGDDYVITNIDDVRTALLTCMDLKEGVK